MIPTLCSDIRGGEYLTEITAEAFYCPNEDAIVRGRDGQQAPGPDGTVIMTAVCSLCGGKVRKVVFPDEEPSPESPAAPSLLTMPEPGLVKQVEGTVFPTLGTDSSIGTIQRPSPKFWNAYAKAVSLKLPPEFLKNIDTVASLSWYSYLDDAQKQALLDRFRDSGTLEIPDDAFGIARANPKEGGASAMSGTEMSAAALSEVSGFARILASPEIMLLASRFWDAKEYDADYDGMHLSVRLRDWETSPFEKGSERSRAKGEIHEVRATVGGLPIAVLTAQWSTADGLVDRSSKYMSKPPDAFELVLHEFGYYSHQSFKSYIKYTGPDLAAAIERILMDAPANVGHIWLRGGVIGYTLEGGGAEDWPDAGPHTTMIDAAKLPKSFLAPFWKAPIVKKGKKLKEIPIEESDLERIQAKIDAKEAQFNRYIEKLYADDIELAKKLDLSPVGVAKLMGDKDYEQLLKERDDLMWAEAPTTSLEPR